MPRELIEAARVEGGSEVRMFWFVVLALMRLALAALAARYRVQLVNRTCTHALSRGAAALKQGTVDMSGRYLMHHGLTLPWGFPDRMWVIEGQRL